MNPQLYKWLAIINDKSSTGKILSYNNDIVNRSVCNNKNDAGVQKKIKEALKKENAVYLKGGGEYGYG